MQYGKVICNKILRPCLDSNNYRNLAIPMFWITRFNEACPQDLVLTGTKV